MPSLSAAHHAALTAIVEACPDASLGMLGAAVAALKGDKAAELANIVATEARDRARRGTALRPCCHCSSRAPTACPPWSFRLRS